MTGYTPVFRSVFEGSLCGKYPDTAAWLILLALADKNGHVDSTPQFISAVTGMPVDDLLQCINRFMEPDPHSRTTDNEGRRLELIDPDRAWGWRIVNHGKYREKARQAAQTVRQIEDGRNAEKVRRYKERKASDTNGHHGTPTDTLSNSNSNSNTNTEKKARKRAQSIPVDFELTEPMREYALKLCPDMDTERTFDDFKNYHLGKGTTAVDWTRSWMTWVSNCQKGFNYVRAERREIVEEPISPAEWARRKRESVQSKLVGSEAPLDPRVDQALRSLLGARA